jgi:hypothetical protein
VSRLIVAVAVAGIVAVVSGCGGAGRPACTIYDHSSKMYLVFRGPGSAQEARRACSRLSEELQAHRSSFGASKGNGDYSGDIRVCAVHGAGGELDIYDTRSNRLARGLCRSFRQALTT